MCTITWHTFPDGYRLLFTRDELRSRAAARPPAIRFARGIAYSAPTDPDRGGTWIGVNDLGVTHCIVNTYGGPIGRGLREHLVELAPVTRARFDVNSPRLRPSRGALVRDLMHCESPEWAARVLLDWRIDRVPDFCLLQFTPGRDPTAFLKENGVLYRTTVRIPPVTTSGHRTETVERFRFECFDSLVGPEPVGAETYAPQARRLLAKFHAYRHRSDAALGVRMLRGDGRSVSLTSVEVDPESVSMGYRAIPEHGSMRALHAWTPTVSLSRRCRRANGGGERHGTEKNTVESVPPPSSPGARVFEARRLFEERAPALARRLPPGTFPLLERILHVRLVNEVVARLSYMGTAEFCEYVLGRLDIRLRVEGLEHLDATDGRAPVFCSNHPTGGVEGVALIALIERRYGSVLLPANEILGSIRPLEPVMVPIDRYRGNATVAGRYATAFASSSPVLVFPAGRTARIRAGRAREFPWS